MTIPDEHKGDMMTEESGWQNAASHYPRRTYQGTGIWYGAFTGLTKEERISLRKSDNMAAFDYNRGYGP